MTELDGYAKGLIQSEVAVAAIQSAVALEKISQLLKSSSVYDAALSLDVVEAIDNFFKAMSELMVNSLESRGLTREQIDQKARELGFDL